MREKLLSQWSDLNAELGIVEINSMDPIKANFYKYLRVDRFIHYANTEVG